MAVSKIDYIPRVDFRSDVYTGVSGDYLFLTQTPGSNYNLVNAYDGNWDNGSWLAKGIMRQGNSYAIFFDKTLTNATIRVNSIWIK